MTRSYYASVLGVSPDAGAAEIKAAYRSLVKKYHPDVNPSPNARDKFIELKKAYDYLLATPYQRHVTYATVHPAQKREEEFKKRREQRMRYAREMRKKKEEQERADWESFQRSPLKWVIVFLLFLTYFVIAGVLIMSIRDYPYVGQNVKDPNTVLVGNIFILAFFTYGFYRFYKFVRE